MQRSSTKTITLETALERIRTRKALDARADRILDVADRIKANPRLVAALRKVRSRLARRRLVRALRVIRRRQRERRLMVRIAVRNQMRAAAYRRLVHALRIIRRTRAYERLVAAIHANPRLWNNLAVIRDTLEHRGGGTRLLPGHVGLGIQAVRVRSTKQPLPRREDGSGPSLSVRRPFARRLGWVEP